MTSLSKPDQSRWAIPIPRTTIPSFIFPSPSDPLPDTLLYVDTAAPDDFQITLSSLREWSKRMAIGLRRNGLQKGDRVMLVSRNSIFLPIIVLGILMAGGIYVPANPRSVPRELTFQVNSVKPRFLLCEEDATQVVLESLASITKPASLTKEGVFVMQRGFRESQMQTAHHGLKHWFSVLADREETVDFNWENGAQPNTNPDDTAMILYSSGTSGLPKGVEATHYNLVANALQMNHMFNLGTKQAAAQGVSSPSRWLCCLPIYHGFPAVFYFTIAPHRRVPTYIMRDFDRHHMLSAIEKFRITDLAVVPPIVVGISKDVQARQGKYDLSSVKEVLCAAAPLAREQAEAFEQIWPNKTVNLKQAFGLTEMCGFPIMWNPNERSDSAAVGELVPNCEAMIMSEDGTTRLPDGQRGELWCRAPTRMKGYWHAPEATNETITKDGWLKTGDIAIRDSNGRYHIVDRKKEFLKVKGSQVAPAELEGILLEHPEIIDAGVVGVKMEDTELPRAYVVRAPDSSLSAQNILDYMAPKTSKIKWLTGGVRFVDSIPRTPSGKILRRLLRAQIEAEQEARSSKAHI